MAWSISNAMMKDYENWHCSQGQGGASSEVSCLDGEQSAQSNTTPTPDQYYWPDKTTEHSRLSSFGMTCVLLKGSHGEDLLMWYQAVFLAKILAPQDKAQGLTVKDRDYGRNLNESLAKYDHDTHSLKTAQCSLLEDLIESSVIFPRWGTMRNGVLFQQPIAEQTMSERGFGSLLPTPTCHNAKEMACPSEYNRNTPTLATHVGGKIHPEFTEWMMGWPIGHTDLKPLATDKCQSVQQRHGKS
jgi:hypothetical protein